MSKLQSCQKWICKLGSFQKKISQQLLFLFSKHLDTMSNVTDCGTGRTDLCGYESCRFQIQMSESESIHSFSAFLFFFIRRLDMFKFDFSLQKAYGSFTKLFNQDYDLARFLILGVELVHITVRPRNNAALISAIFGIACFFCWSHLLVDRTS